MAVLRQELTRTTFQDRQIKLMTDIYSGVRDIDKTIGTKLSDLKLSLSSSFDSSIQGLYYSFVRYLETGTAAFVSDLEDIMGDLREGIDEDADSRERDNNREDHREQAERYQNYITTQRDTLSKIKTIASLVTSISKIFGVSLDRFMDIADTVSDLQNTAVRNTSLRRSEIVEFRDFVSDKVDTMNERTNNLYSKVSSFELLVGLINQTGIKNLEFYEEYGELFITTQKTMNVNLGTLAEFANNFYRVYKFSSSGMENLMESIRKNTAGTSTDEEKLTSFLSTVASDVRYFEYRTGGKEGLEDRTTASLDRIGGVYTWLRELGFNSDDLFNQVLAAGRGGVSSSEYADLVKLGIRMSPEQLMTRLLTDPASLMIEILQKQGGWSAKLGTNSSALASTIGYDFTNATQAEIFMDQLTRGNYESFMANRKASDNPEDDIWLSAEERTANATEDLGVQMSDLQESLGVSLKTIYAILEKILAAVVALKGVSLLGRLFGGGGGSGGGSWLTNLLGGGGGAAVAGGAAKSGLLSKIGSFLGSPLGKLGAAGIGVGLVVNDSLNNHGNDDLINEETGELTEWGIEAGLTEADAAKYMEKLHSNEDRLTKFNRLIGDRFGDKFQNWSDMQIAQNYYDFLRGNPADKEIKDYRSKKKGTYARGRHKFLDRLLDAVEWQWQYGNGGEDLDPYTFYNYGTPEEDFDQPIFYEQYPNWEAPWKSSKWDGNPEAPSYAVGTPYVPDDQYALLHEGEAVVPAAENPFNKYTSNSSNRYSYLKSIAESSKNIESGSNGMSTVIEYLSSILVFLKYWKDDNESNDVVNSVLENARTMNLKLQLVTGDATLASDGVG